MGVVRIDAESVLKKPTSKKIAAKAAATTPAAAIVRDARTGQFVTVKGAGALKGSTFAIKKGVDLTKPIARQVLKRSPRDTERRKAKG